MNQRRVIENTRSGERIVLLQTAADTNGQLLEFELLLGPGGRVPSGHVHPHQEERFTVLDGLMRFRLGGRAVMVKAGDSVTVRPGVAHAFANAGSGPARLRVEVRPALKMEVLLEAAAALSRERTGMPLGLPRPLDLALFLREFETEVAVPFLPPMMVRLGTRALAWLARLRGAEVRYRRLRSATADAREGIHAIKVRSSQPE
jgi:quercetin dioxygenase-like cupin family protein